MKPSVSVVMPLFNKEQEVGRAVSSVLEQSFSDFELLVFNDGSTDHSGEVVRGIADPRIRMFEQKNMGVSASRNRGISEAQAELVAFIDADDEWMPEYLSTIWKLKVKFPQCRVYATGYLFCLEGHAERPILLRGVEYSFSEGILHNYFTVASASDPPLWTSAVCVSKDALVDIGGFPVGVVEGEDLLTWARLAAKYEIAYSQKAMARYHSPLNATERPDRLPQKPDLVAQGLEELLVLPKKQRLRGIQQYLGLWHQMRAVNFIKQNRRKDARTEIRLAANRGGMSLHLLVLFLISFLPGKYPAILHSKIKAALHDLRVTQQVA